MSNVFVIIKMCYVHNQWYDIVAPGSGRGNRKVAYYFNGSLGFHKTREISWLTAEHLASQKGLLCLELGITDWLGGNGGEKIMKGDRGVDIKTDSQRGRQANKQTCIQLGSQTLGLADTKNYGNSGQWDNIILVLYVLGITVADFSKKYWR